MKIQPIEFPLGIGTAYELRIIVNEFVAYYKLVDTTKITVISNGPEIPYKILYSDTLKLENKDITEEEVSNMIINLLGLTLID